MKEFWNKRYAEPAFVYGTSPNEFFKQQLDQLTPGTLLLPAEGEGRNAAYAASKGWDVTACDYSDSGKQKAEQLAEKMDVSFDYRVADFGELIVAGNHFDCVGLIYAHFNPDTRAGFHKKIVNSLKPGGVILLEAFSKEQLGKSSGGPKDLDTLFSEEVLRSDFAELSSVEIWQEEVGLDEGEHHRGHASVIRMVGRK